MTTPSHDANLNSPIAHADAKSSPLRWGRAAGAPVTIPSVNIPESGLRIVPAMVNASMQDARPIQPARDSTPLRTSLPGIQIQSTGLYTPANCVTNDDLARHGYESEWVLQRTGIEARYIAGPEEATSDMAVEAGADCLRLARVHPQEVDLILLATMTSDHATPTSANLVQAGLGCSCPAVDVNSACSGFVYAMIMGSQFLMTGCSRKVLVIGAEKTSLLADPENKKTFPLFGDGAGAVLLGMAGQADQLNTCNSTIACTEKTAVNGDADQESQSPGILSYRLASLGELGDCLVVPAGGSREPTTVQSLAAGRNYLRMDGRPVFKWAVRLVPEIIDELLALAGLEIDDIDLLVMHQANRRIIDASLETVNIPDEKVFINVDRYGNTSAASIPIALHEAVVQGQINPGSKVMLVGFGGGLTWGGCIMQW